MKVTFFLLAGLLALSGCATQSALESSSSVDYGQPPKMADQIIKNYFDSVLKDPYSAVIKPYAKPTPYVHTVLWRKFAGYGTCYSVNAKNAYGGYVGERLYLFVLNNERIAFVEGQKNDNPIGAWEISQACNRLR